MFLTTLLNTLFPPACLICNEKIDQSGQLCASCFSKLKFTKADYSHNLFQEKRFYTKVCSALEYDETSKFIILALKYGDRLDVVPVLSHFMFLSGQEVLDQADLLIPVPLHWKRLLLRKYNQAGVLCQALSKKTHIASDLFSLKRIHGTLKQGHLSKQQRFENISGAFCVQDKEKIANKIIVLIDDVITSGATVNACAKELVKAGAKEVRVLTVASVKK